MHYILIYALMMFSKCLSVAKTDRNVTELRKILCEKYFLILLHLFVPLYELYITVTVFGFHFAVENSCKMLFFFSKFLEPHSPYFAECSFVCTAIACVQ